MKTAFANVMALSLALGLFYGRASGQPPIPPQEQPQVLTRGPVHEAFSEPIILQMQDGLVVPNQPPADIEETPPADRPQGDQYVWVPGYWSWDGDRNNFVWVSGCWRAAPPNMSWVPGYWYQVDDGWEWVAGFWTPADSQDVEYLPAPPTTYDQQPPSSSPSSHDIWVPPCPYWDQDRFVVRPGYWLAGNPDWVWAPSHYVWSPRGYVFCDGHWDYPLADRGVLFAPVYFPSSVYGRSDYRYSPSIVINLGVLTANLFTYPRYSHYYFGDYYDDAYLNVGIYPRDDVDRIHTWYDPTFVYDRWNHRSESGWVANERHDYEVRHADVALRPPRTYQEMETHQVDKLPKEQQNNFRMAEPLTVAVANKQTSIKFEHIDTNAQQKAAVQATAVHSFTAERSLRETTPALKKAVQPPVEPKVPATTLSNQNRPTMTADRKSPVTSPVQQQPQAAQPRVTKTQFVPPREVRVTQPERVKVSAPPIVGRQVAAKKSLPARPANERKYTSTVKAAPKGNQDKGNSKDAGKDKSKGQ